MFRRLKRRWAQAEHDTADDYFSTKDEIGVAEREIADIATSITFTLTFAHGGKLLTTKFYNAVKDEYDRAAYVIPDADDFGESIKEIVLNECLKNG
jgi:hypothetical protein